MYFTRWLDFTVIYDRRIDTGSAAVALTTAAGIVSPIIAEMQGMNLELLVIATEAGSLMFPHMNDGGFWVVKEYLGLTVEKHLKHGQCSKHFFLSSHSVWSCSLIGSFKTVSAALKWLETLKKSRNNTQRK